MARCCCTALSKARSSLLSSMMDLYPLSTSQSFTRAAVSCDSVLCDRNTSKRMMSRSDAVPVGVEAAAIEEAAAAEVPAGFCAIGGGSEDTAYLASGGVAVLAPHPIWARRLCTVLRHPAQNRSPCQVPLLAIS